MPDRFTTDERSSVMRSVRARGNRTTELHLMTLFRSNRVSGWRRHLPIHGNPDFAFLSLRLVVFCDGCFWHACPKHGRIPQNNRAYWRAKILRNANRDRQVSKSLRRLGWKVVRVWEHEISRNKIPTKLARALEQLGGKSRVWSPSPARPSTACESRLRALPTRR